MIKLKIYLKLLIFTLLLNQNLLAQLTIDEIIDKNLAITGLLSENKAISSFEIGGKFTQNQFGFPIKMWVILPNHLRMNMVFNGVNFVKSSDGVTDWESSPMKDTIMVKKGKPGEANDFYSRWTGSLSWFKEGEITGELIGVETIEDVETYKLKIKKGDKTRIYYIDKLSFLLLRVDDDENAKKITYYSDYKKVGDYLLAHKMEGFESGKLAIIMEFESVKINTSVDMELFKVPEKE